MTAIYGLSLLAITSTRGAALLEESFNYAAGSNLGSDSPWSGIPAVSLAVTAGNLSMLGLQSISPAGNELQVTGGTSTRAYRMFSSAPVATGAVYCSFLVNCSMLPTNSQFTVCLLSSGETTPSPPDDPLDFYVRPAGGGYTFSIRASGSDTATAVKVLSQNSTHLVVLKYVLGSIGQASLYVDPIPGNPEPAPDATTSSDDDEIGNVVLNLQGLLIQSPTGFGQGSWIFDTLRIGTSWFDVTPFAAPLFLTGPADQAICSGSPATFSVIANGTPPYSYSWRTNGVSIPGATNSDLQLPSAGMLDTSNVYDVIVRDGFGAITSDVARLTISTTAASILRPPANQLVLPSSTQAVFNVVAAGDAPLAYQWRSNGVEIAGATNSSYSIANPTAADSSVTYDVTVSNPCGTVTSSPPVSLIFPHVFYAAYDAGPGFFSGENLALTNLGGLALQTWSSPMPGAPITGWTLEGPMQEQPMNDGSGLSLYSINVTPGASPEFYIFGTSLTPPYLMPVPVLAVTTDPSGFYLLISSNMVSFADGRLFAPAGSVSIRLNPAGGIELTSLGVPGSTYLLQYCTSLQPPIQWTTIETNVADPMGLLGSTQSNLSPPFRFYQWIAP